MPLSNGVHPYWKDRSKSHCTRVWAHCTESDNAKCPVFYLYPLQLFYEGVNLQPYRMTSNCHRDRMNTLIPQIYPSPKYRTQGLLESSTIVFHIPSVTTIWPNSHVVTLSYIELNISALCNGLTYLVVLVQMGQGKQYNPHT